MSAQFAARRACVALIEGATQVDSDGTLRHLPQSLRLAHSVGEPPLRRTAPLEMKSYLRPVQWALGRFSVDMGIDLGTANTLVSVRGRGIVLNEPSVVAVDKATGEVMNNGMAVGVEAKAMLGKTPGNIAAIRPLRNGVIADFDVTEKMLRYFITKVHGGRAWVKPRIVIAVPVGITAVERRAVINSAERAGARRVYLIDEPMAAGLGIQLPVREAFGSLIVDIGGGTTDIAVLALAEMVVATSLRIAGDEMDEAIVAHLRRQHNLLIGEQTSERIKLTIGSAWPMKQELSMEVKGRDSVSGLPRKTTVTSIEIREALSAPVRLICEAVRGVLEEAPPEISADLVDSGITLCGGGSLLYGIAEAIADTLSIPVQVADDPLTAVARGTGVFLENLEIFAPVLSSDEDD